MEKKVVEISTWALVVNALYYLPKNIPMSLNCNDKEYFWRYLLMAAEEMEKHFPDLRLYTDKGSLENVLYNDNLYINKGDNCVSLDAGVTWRDIDDINEYKPLEITGRFKEIFKDAYAKSLTYTSTLEIK